jgi:hypothetical protein
MANRTHLKRWVRPGLVLLVLLAWTTSVGAESLVPDGRDGGPGVGAVDALARLKSQYGRPPVIPFPVGQSAHATA